MKVVKLTVRELVSFLGNEVLRILGETNEAYIDNLADVEHVCETTLDWVKPTNPNRQIVIEQSKAKVLLVDEGVTPVTGKILIVVKDPKRALAKVGNHFFVERPAPGIHPTAVVDPEAEIGNDVYVGPYAVIGKAKIGEGCVIESNVRIYNGVTIGCDSSIKSGAVLGGEGFGFEKDENGNRFRFPQIGCLVIGNDVEIGANTCIDRGALSDTIIGDHTKINNLCHIAHNNKIGRNVVVAGCVNVSGSCVIEDNVWISPNVSLRGFNRLGESCTVGTGAVVTKDIPAGETWIGNPARRMDTK